MDTIQGIDISSHQGSISWDAVKRVKQFAFIKASEGNNFKDPQLDRNRVEARRLGIACGYYHFARPDINGQAPQGEADWFLKVVGTPKDGEILVLDWERSESRVDYALAFLNHIKAKLGGYKAMIYMNRSAMNSNNWDPVIDGDYGLWLAAWNNDPNSVPASPWPVVACKQYTSTGKVPGINGNVDLDTFFGSVETFHKYGYQAPEPPENPLLKCQERVKELELNIETLEEENEALKAANVDLKEENTTMDERLKKYYDFNIFISERFDG